MILSNTIKPMPVIIDTDIGMGSLGADIDDGIALGLALSSPELNILGITTVCGNVETVAATHNALALLEHSGHSQIPVAAGAEQPISQSLVTFRKSQIEMWKGDPFHGAVTSLRPIKKSAVDFFLETANLLSQPMTIIAIGPLTNIALALGKEPGLTDLISDIVIMGGVVWGPGNVTPYAEFNFYADPEAARRVFQSRARLTLISLDVTEKKFYNEEWFTDILESSPTPLNRYLCQHAIDWIKAYCLITGRDGCPLHDALAVAYVIDPNLVKTRDLQMDIETAEQESRGKVLITDCRRADRLSFIRTSIEADSERISLLLQKRLKKN